MSPNFAEVESQVRQLPPEERARLAEILLESLVELNAPSVQEAWDAEIRARVAAFERGELDLVPAEEVFASARKFSRDAGRRGERPPSACPS
jgi:putative addiction module component (TIGR02574 family)